MMQHPFTPLVSGEYKKIFCLSINWFNNRYHTARKVHTGTSYLVSQFNKMAQLVVHVLLQKISLLGKGQPGDDTLIIT